VIAILLAFFAGIATVAVALAALVMSAREEMRRAGEIYPTIHAVLFDCKIVAYCARRDLAVSVVRGIRQQLPGVKLQIVDYRPASELAVLEGK
jgi:hypothetical protein